MESTCVEACSYSYIWKGQLSVNQYSKIERVYEKETSEGGGEENNDNTGGIPSLRGWDWRE